MPAKRKSLAALELVGSTKRNPGRYQQRTDAPLCGPLGDPPVHLSVAAKNVWAELANSVPDGHLQSADRFLVELACKLICSIRNRHTEAKNSELNLLVTVLSKLGMSPSDRNKIDITPQKPETPEHDPWEQLR